MKTTLIATLIATLAVGLLIAAPARAQAPLPTPKAAAVDAVIRTFPEFAGVVLVAKDGKPLFERAYGEANREWGIPNSTDTKFRIGSMTKAFTAASIMQLQEAGKLNIDESVTKYLPNPPAAWQPVTLRHLLNHTSGISRSLPRQGEIAREDTTPDKMIELIRDQPLLFKPGEKQQYSNNGYMILGKVIEALSGQSYADYVRDHIMAPAGMTSSGYDRTSIVLPRRASGYAVFERRVANSGFISMTLPYSAGSLYSTADDMLRWDQALTSDKLVSAASRAEMFKDDGFGYGFGWEILTKFGHRNISHGGAINGFAAQIDRYPDDRITVIVLSNMQAAKVDTLSDDLAALYLGLPARRPFAGAEAAIRRVFEGLQKGELAADDLTPQGAQALKPSLASNQAQLSQLGKLKTVELLNADAPGFDRYRLTFDNGALVWGVRFDDVGKITPLGAFDLPTKP